MTVEPTEGQIGIWIAKACKENPDGSMLKIAQSVAQSAYAHTHAHALKEGQDEAKLLNPIKQMDVVEVIEALYTLERQTGVDSRHIADFLEGKCWADSSEIKDKMRIVTNHL